MAQSCYEEYEYPYQIDFGFNADCAATTISVIGARTSFLTYGKGVSNQSIHNSIQVSHDIPICKGDQ